MKDSAQLIKNRLDTIKEIEAKDELQHLAFKVSRRECQIFSMLCEGYSNKEIAKKLHISAHTVISHRLNLRKKIGARNTAHLIHLTYKNQL